jgi:hypothetical protein
MLILKTCTGRITGRKILDPRKYTTKRKKNMLMIDTAIDIPLVKCLENIQTEIADTKYKYYAFNV